MAERFSVTLLDSPGNGVRVEWDKDTLAGLLTASSDAPPQPAWALASELPDWDRWSSLRVLSAAFGDGQMIALAALRPAKAQGHGDELVGGVILRDGGATPFEEVLLSTQYDGDGAITHVNVEAYEGEDSVAVRAAGDRLASSSGADDAAALAVTVLAMRMDGEPGLGTFDVMSSG
jgi:hypothetical protein